MKLFKFSLIVLLLLPFQTEAQRGKKPSYNDPDALHMFFGSNDKDFEINQAPEDWQSEPVVLLCQKTNVRFTRKNSGARTIKGALRKRILIQDKAALEDFSEFYYSQTESMGIQIIKPDGSKKDINLDEAVKVETDVPRFYQDSYSSSQYYKVAIPDLAVGDILDYYKVFSSEASQTEIINPVANVYPTVYQEIIFDVKGWSFFHNTFNGAPAFTKKAVKSKKGKDSGMVRYMITDKNRKAENDERWSFTYLSEPIYKVMALPTNERIGTKKLKETVADKLDVKEVFLGKLKEGKKIYISSQMKKVIRSEYQAYKVKKMPKKERARYMYNLVRSVFTRNAGEYITIRSDVFIESFISNLKAVDIEAFPVVVTARYFGGIDEVVNEQEMEFGVYVPSLKQYFWTVDNFRSSADKYEKISFSEGYLYRDKKFKKILTPKSSPEDNVTSSDFEITINEDNSLDFIGSRSFQGTYKRYYSSLFLFQTDYLYEDRYYFSSEKERKKMDKRKAKAEAAPQKSRSKRTRQWQEQLKNRKEELSKRKQEVLTDWLKDDYELEELKDFTVTSFGRFPESNTLEATIQFNSKGYLKKAGPNLIFEVGKLITGQVELDEDEIKERNTPIDMEYARTIKNTFSIVLSEGFKAQGLDGLNMNVDNPYAAFISTATQEDNILTIETSKIYKQEHFDKSHWPEMVKMLEAAYDFSQRKIILKK